MRIFNRIKPHEISAFLGSLAFLLESQSTPQLALETLTRACGKNVKPLVNALLGEVRNGENLSDSFEKRKELSSYAAAVKAGEQCGKTPEILRRVSERIASKTQTAAKLKTALYYPAFILLLTFGVALYMLKFIVPQFQTMLAETTGGGLPALTVFIITLSDIVINQWLAGIIVIALSVIGIRWLIKKPLKMQFSALSLDIPVIGKIIRNGEYSDFFETLSFLLDAGLNSADSLKSAADAVRNPLLASQLRAAYGDVSSNGSTLSGALVGVRSLSEIEKQCILIGEPTGQLCSVLKNLSLDLLSENEQLTKRFTSLLQPLLTVIVGTVVGVIMLAMYLPVISIMQI